MHDGQLCDICEGEIQVTFDRRKQCLLIAALYNLYSFKNLVKYQHGAV